MAKFTVTVKVRGGEYPHTVEAKDRIDAITKTRKWAESTRLVKGRDVPTYSAPYK